MSTSSGWRSPFDLLFSAFENYPLPTIAVATGSTVASGYFLVNNSWVQRHKYKIMGAGALGAAVGGYFAYQKAKPMIDDLWALHKAMSSSNESPEAERNKAMVNDARVAALQRTFFAAIHSMHRDLAAARSVISARFPVDAIRERVAAARAKQDGSEYPHLHDLKVACLSRSITSVYVVAFFHAVVKVQMSIVARYTLADSTLPPALKDRFIVAAKEFLNLCAHPLSTLNVPPSASSESDTSSSASTSSSSSSPSPQPSSSSSSSSSVPSTPSIARTSSTSSSAPLATPLTLLTRAPSVSAPVDPADSSAVPRKGFILTVAALVETAVRGRFAHVARLSNASPSTSTSASTSTSTSSSASSLSAASVDVEHLVPAALQPVVSSGRSWLTAQVDSSQLAAMLHCLRGEIEPALRGTVAGFLHHTGATGLRVLAEGDEAIASLISDKDDVDLSAPGAVTNAYVEAGQRKSVAQGLSPYEAKTRTSETMARSLIASLLVPTVSDVSAYVLLKDANTPPYVPPPPPPPPPPLPPTPTPTPSAATSGQALPLSQQQQQQAPFVPSPYVAVPRRDPSIVRVAEMAGELRLVVSGSAFTDAVAENINAGFEQVLAHCAALFASTPATPATAASASSSSDAGAPASLVGAAAAPASSAAMLKVAIRIGNAFDALIPPSLGPSFSSIPATPATPASQAGQGGLVAALEKLEGVNAVCRIVYLPMAPHEEQFGQVPQVSGLSSLFQSMTGGGGGGMMGGLGGDLGLGGSFGSPPGAMRQPSIGGFGNLSVNPGAGAFGMSGFGMSGDAMGQSGADMGMSEADIAEMQRLLSVFQEAERRGVNPDLSSMMAQQPRLSPASPLSPTGTPIATPSSSNINSSSSSGAENDGNVGSFPRGYHQFQQRWTHMEAAYEASVSRISAPAQPSSAPPQTPEARAPQRPKPTPAVVEQVD